MRSISSANSCGTANRGLLTFHRSTSPSAQAVTAGFGQSSIAIAIANSDRIKLYRSVNNKGESVAEMLQMPIDNTSNNSLACAPAHLQPEDVIAAA